MAASLRQSGVDVGKVLARLLPRCTDEVVGVRRSAVSAVGVLLFVSAKEEERDALKVLLGQLDQLR